MLLRTKDCTGQIKDYPCDYLLKELLLNFSTKSSGREPIPQPRRFMETQPIPSLSSQAVMSFYYTIRLIFQFGKNRESLPNDSNSSLK